MCIQDKLYYLKEGTHGVWVLEGAQAITLMGVVYLLFAFFKT